MCKLKLKDSSFKVSFDQKPRNLERFLWKVTLYGFLCLCFELQSVEKYLTESKKIKQNLTRSTNFGYLL